MSSPAARPPRFSVLEEGGWDAFLDSVYFPHSAVTGKEKQEPVGGKGNKAHFTLTLSPP